MLERVVTIHIGGKTYLCPPMPFYCLERAWPHIQALGRQGVANNLIITARQALERAVTDEDRAAATTRLVAAISAADAEGADFIGQTREVLHILAAALALSDEAPSYDTLSRQIRPDELVGVHGACTELMSTSGLMQDAATGEASATIQAVPGLSNGARSSLN